MAIELFELVEPLKRAVSPPGVVVFPDATDTMFAGYLSDAFWEIRMLGMFTNYTEADLEVSPITGIEDLPREQQSLIILFAAITIVTNELKNLETVFRVKAGPAEFETQKSATLLRDVLAELQRRRTIVEENLLSLGEVTDAYIDSVWERDLHYGTYWIN